MGIETGPTIFHTKLGFLGQNLRLNFDSSNLYRAFSYLSMKVVFSNSHSVIVCKPNNCYRWCLTPFIFYSFLSAGPLNHCLFSWRLLHIVSPLLLCYQITKNIGTGRYVEFDYPFYWLYTSANRLSLYPLSVILHTFFHIRDFRFQIAHSFWSI